MRPFAKAFVEPLKSKAPLVPGRPDLVDEVHECLHLLVHGLSRLQVPRELLGELGGHSHSQQNAMPFAPRGFLFLVVMPGAPSSVLTVGILIKNLKLEGWVTGGCFVENSNLGGLVFPVDKDCCHFSAGFSGTHTSGRCFWFSPPAAIFGSSRL